MSDEQVDDIWGRFGDLVLLAETVANQARAFEVEHGFKPNCVLRPTPPEIPGVKRNPAHHIAGLRVFEVVGLEAPIVAFCEVSNDE